MRVARVVFSTFFAFVLTLSLAAKQTTTSDPGALSLLQRSLNVLSGGQSLTDVTLSGNARRIAGSDDDTGTAVLKALATGESRIDLMLASGQRNEVRAISNHCQVGSWSGPDGVARAISNHNLMTDSAWFFPAFTLGRLGPSGKYTVSYFGPETRDGQEVEHLTAYQPSTVRLPIGVPTLQHLTKMDLFLYSLPLLPPALAFNIHPDNDMGLDIRVEIRFSDYRAVSGVQVPFHIQKYLNNGLALDLQLQTATLNTGLAPAAFSIP